MRFNLEVEGISVSVLSVYGKVTVLDKEASDCIKINSDFPLGTPFDFAFRLVPQMMEITTPEGKGIVIKNSKFQEELLPLMEECLKKHPIITKAYWINWANVRRSNLGDKMIGQVKFRNMSRVDREMVRACIGKDKPMLGHEILTVVQELEDNPDFRCYIQLDDHNAYVVQVPELLFKISADFMLYEANRYLKEHNHKEQSDYKISSFEDIRTPLLDE